MTLVVLFLRCVIVSVAFWAGEGVGCQLEANSVGSKPHNYELESLCRFTRIGEAERYAGVLGDPLR